MSGRVSMPIAIVAEDVLARTTASLYPPEFAERVQGRIKRALGDRFGLTHFGINLTRLRPGAQSALRHAHARQDEFVYVLEGTLVLRTDAGDTALSAGMCAGFAAGTGDAHQLLNQSAVDAVFLEVGDRSADDVVTYPDDDLAANFVEGRWVFVHKDGSPYT